MFFWSFIHRFFSFNHIFLQVLSSNSSSLSIHSQCFLIHFLTNQSYYYILQSVITVFSSLLSSILPIMLIKSEFVSLLPLLYYDNLILFLNLHNYVLVPFLFIIIFQVISLILKFSIDFLEYSSVNLLILY
jgi:hypothetical protein